MLINVNANRWKAKVEKRTCEYHKHNPDKPSYAGCTCTTTYAAIFVDEWEETSNCVVKERVGALRMLSKL